MKLGKIRSTAPFVLSLLLISVLATSAVAFDTPLSSEAIRDAYFLATGNAGKRDAFFAQYSHSLPMPETGPNIALISLQTPFAAVVQDIAVHSLNLRAPDAEQDFYGRPAQFRVTAQIYFTPTYPAGITIANQLDSFWNDFHIRVNQGGEVPSLSERGEPIFSDQTTSGYIGATIVADYDVDKIQSGPITVEVAGPDGSHGETSFDLSSLR